MKKIFVVLGLLVMSLLPRALTAEEIPAQLIGRIVMDVSAGGEAWYINPRSQMRVFLGRPEEALERLKARAFFVGYMNIARIAPDNGQPSDGDLAYVEEVAGNVIVPNDVIGAAWYVDPDRHVRRRLATPNDAWRLMLDAVPVTAADLAGIPIEGLDQPRFETAAVAEVLDGMTVKLADGRKVRLASILVPDNADLQTAAMSRLHELLDGQTIVLERDRKNEMADGQLRRFVHAGDVNVNCDLVRLGLAFDEIEFPNFGYAEQLIVSRLDAARHGYGFWAQQP
ncbi:MAG: hypothetical protein V1738_03060 [Patescibacteria group bacterium]